MQVHSTHVLPGATPRPELATVASAPRVRVLVAEDDPVQALVLLSFLARFDVEVVHVTDGIAAVAEAMRGRHELVLMDCLMPGLSGIEATRAIRGAEEAAGRPRVPIVAVTASAMPDECRGCLEAGMDEVLTKPFHAQALRELLTRQLGLAAWAASSR